jgi:delta-lactam-biosynthetic de-N-acetylase
MPERITHAGRQVCAAKTAVIFISVIFIMLFAVTSCQKQAAGKIQTDEKNIERGVIAPPVWKSIDKQALAQAWGWKEVSRGNTAKHCVALTFDAGEEGQYTPAILDALKAASVRVTFFVTGRFAESYPDLVQRMAAEGHEIANHSWSHPSFLKLSPKEVRDQIVKTDAKLTELCGYSPQPYFRFPFGERNEALLEEVKSLGYMSIYWTYDTRDWELATTPQAIHDGVLSHVANGAIFLMHCGSRQESVVLPVILKDLKTAGYTIITVSEALALGP